MRRQMNPNSLANLIPAKKGEVRNPNGARRRDREETPQLIDWSDNFSCPKEKVKEFIAIWPELKGQKLTQQRAELLEVRKQILNGNLEKIPWLADRREGKVKEVIRHEIPDIRIGGDGAENENNLDSLI